MRRAVVALGSTVAGLAALLSFKTHSGTAVADTTALAPATSASSAGTPAATPSKGSSAHTSAKASQKISASASTKASASKSSASKTGGGSTAAATPRVITGQVINTPYGPMQVQVTLAGQKITAVKVLQQTDTGSYSQQLDANAIPQLTSETLAADSAHIDAVSGASYTSSGYVQSLQSALDQA